MSEIYFIDAAPLRLLRCLGRSAAVAAIFAVATPALAVTQSWNGYHWARTGPLVIRIGDNVSATWKPYLQTAATKWSAANNISFLQVAGTTAATGCDPVYGGVQVCSANYGANGWLGYANVWLSSGFIVEATVKLNDYYFGQARYNTDAWRDMTACQEIGHTLGLAHNDTNRTDANNGTCMDYTNDPTGTAGGANGTLANTAPSASDFAALDGIYANLNATQLDYTKPQWRAGDGYFISGADGHDGLVAVPEPATWALLIVGFGLVGTIARRRFVNQIVKATAA